MCISFSTLSFDGEGCRLLIGVFICLLSVLQELFFYCSKLFPHLCVSHQVFPWQFFVVVVVNDIHFIDKQMLSFFGLDIVVIILDL